MKRDIAKTQATFDFILDQYENGTHLDDVAQVVNDNLEDFLAIGCEATKLASMMNPVDVLNRVELFKVFKDFDINPVAKRLDYVDFETFFEQLVTLGIKADSVRNLVAEWDGETIIGHIAELLKCGFSKEELSDLLFEKIDEYDSGFFNAEYLDLVSTSKHLYAFLSKERLDYAEYSKFWTHIEALLERGADKTVITKWIANHMAHDLFYKDFQEELRKRSLFPTEEQIVNALDLGCYENRIHDWMRELGGDPNPLFMEFMDSSENPHELMSMLNGISDCEIIDYCECNCYDVTEDYVLRFPNFWKNAVILFLEAHSEGMHYELCCSLQILDWLQIDESEWKKVLSGHKEWLKECIKEFKSDPYDDYTEEIKFLNKIIQFAS